MSYTRTTQHVARSGRGDSQHAQGNSAIPTLQRRSSIIEYLSSLPKRPHLPTLRSKKSSSSLSSLESVSESQPDNTRQSCSGHQQAMIPAILRSPEVTQKLLETILESQGGKRSLARLARTCKAFKEPALDALWKDLENFLPLVCQFPTSTMKRSRRPALGFARNPEKAEWERVLSYASRVKSITYVEAFNSFSQSIFIVLQQTCPRQHFLPNLTSLTWKAETAAGLSFASSFLTPSLKTFTLEMGVRAPRLNDFLDEVMSKTHLTAFNFSLHSNLPDNFVQKMSTNKRLEKVAVMAPGALAARVGKWAAGLPLLRSFQVDLTNASTRQVEGFFADIIPTVGYITHSRGFSGDDALGSGWSTPSSFGRDSGVFSADDEEFDFASFRKSAMRLTSSPTPSPALTQKHGAFPNLISLNITGDAQNLSTFLKHLSSPLNTLELAMEDPSVKEDWSDLCGVVSGQFGVTLQTFRVTAAASSSRIAELVRSTSRGANDIQLKHLPLVHFSNMPKLTRFEIELPESVIFHNADVTHLARVCPNVEVVRLCGQAKFSASFGSPYLTLEGIAPLTTNCKRLHTLAVVIDALPASESIFVNTDVSSRSLMRLNVGHSWVHDPLQAALLLSHLAPYLETLKWFYTPRNSGFGDVHSGGWAQVDEMLGPVQKMRVIERSMKPREKVVELPVKKDIGVDATVATSSKSIMATPRYVDCETMAIPEKADVEIEAMPSTCSIEIDATPELVEQEVSALPSHSEMGTDPYEPPEEEDAEIEMIEPSANTALTYRLGRLTPPIFTAFAPTFSGIVTFPFRAVKVYTYYLSLPLRYMFSFTPIYSTPTPTTTSIIKEKEPKVFVYGSAEDASEYEEKCASVSISASSDKNTPVTPPPISLPPSYAKLYENYAHADVYSNLSDSDILKDINPVCQ